MSSAPGIVDGDVDGRDLRRERPRVVQRLHRGRSTRAIGTTTTWLSGRSRIRAHPAAASATQASS